MVIFCTVAVFFRVDRYFPRRLMPAMFIIPAITSGLALSTFEHSLMISSFSVNSTWPATAVSIIRGPWFYVHTAYSLLVLAGIAVIVAVRFKDVPREFRTGTGLMAASIIITAVGVMPELVTHEKNMVDLVLVSASVAGMLFYMAVVLSGRRDYMQIERKEIFNYLDDCVFVMNADGVVLDYNNAAKIWLAALDEECDGHNFDDFMARLYGSGAIIKKEAEAEEDPDATYFASIRYMLIYCMRKRDIYSDRGQRVGAYAIIEDVTRNRLTIERLVSVAGLDSMTGMLNRHGLQGVLRQVDQPENLPLCLIAGDVNKLKYVNDTYGHKIGDEFLVAIGQAIASVIPAGSYAARVGGDEFMVVCPRCDMQQGMQVMHGIETRLAGLQGLPTRPTISMGLAIKQDMDENINMLINQADLLMYHQKGRAPV